MNRHELAKELVGLADDLIAEVGDAEIVEPVESKPVKTRRTKKVNARSFLGKCVEAEDKREPEPGSTLDMLDKMSEEDDKAVASAGMKIGSDRRRRRRLTAAVKDLADVVSVLPEFRKKQHEIRKKQEEQDRELNRLRMEASREVELRKRELLKAIQKELETYFKKNGMGVRKSDNDGGLVEVFIGSEDGVKRYQSKVSAHIVVYHELRATFMLRNEELDDEEGILSSKNTIPKLMQVVKKADKADFWEGVALI